MATHKALYKRAVVHANAVGVMVLLTVLFQYALPAVFLWILRLCGVDTAAALWGLPAASYLCLYLLMYLLTLGIPLCLCKVLLFPKAAAPTMIPPLTADRRLCLTLFGVAMCVLANIFSSFLSDLLYEIGLPTPDLPAMGDGSFPVLLLDILVLALIPAIMEELLMRGIMLSTLRPLGNTASVVASALIFGLLHGNLAQAPYACLMGIILGGIYVHTLSLRPVIAVHAIANTISVVMSYLRLYADSTTASLWGLILLIVVLMSGGIASMWLWRHPLPRSETTGVRSRRAILNAPLLWTAIAVLLILLLIRTL